MVVVVLVLVEEGEEVEEVELEVVEVVGEQSSSPVRRGDFVMDSGVLGVVNTPRLLEERSG